MDTRFVGGWDLIGTEVKDAQGNKAGEMLPGWKGQIAYTPDGRMSAHLIAPEGTVRGAPQGERLPVESYTGYYGTYTIDDAAGCVTHHMMAATTPSLLDSDQRRFFTFEGNRLILQPPIGADGLTRRLIWQKAN